MGRTALLSLLLVALVATAQCKGGADRGIAYLGSFTFYRVVDGSRDVLVRFDEKHYWHTGFDEAFEELAQTVAMSHLVNSSQIDCNKFIVASLPVSKMQHEVDNIVIARRYNISHADFPAIRLFKKGADPKDMPLQPPPEVSTRSPAQMMRWIEQETGVFCGLIGQLKDMHLLAQQLVNNSAAAPELLAKARLVAERVDDSDKDNAKTYLEVFEKAVEDADWPWNEYQRLKAKMPKFSMHVAPDSWRDAQHQRLHILGSFVDSVQEELSELKEEL